MINQLTGKISKTIHLILRELLPLFETPVSQPQSSNISTALFGSSVDNSAILYGFRLGHWTFIEM